MDVLKEAPDGHPNFLMCMKAFWRFTHHELFPRKVKIMHINAILSRVLYFHITVGEYKWTQHKRKVDHNYTRALSLKPKQKCCLITSS